MALVALLLSATLAAPTAGQWRGEAVSDTFAAARWTGPTIRSAAALPSGTAAVSEDAEGYSASRTQAAPGVHTAVPNVQFADSIASGGARFGGALVGGLIGFGVGAGAGFLVGAKTDACGDEWCPLAAATIGAALGESIGMAAGAHLVNRGRGNLLRTATMTTLVGAAGLGLASAFDSGAPATLGVTALVQALMASAIEGSTARARLADTPEQRQQK